MAPRPGIYADEYAKRAGLALQTGQSLRTFRQVASSHPKDGDKM